MRLKAAYFSTPGVVSVGGVVAFGPHDVITDNDRKTAMKEWSVLGLPRSAHNGHDVEFWAALVVAKRFALNRPYSATLANAAVVKASEMYGHWRETLRYRATVPQGGLVRYVRDRADWFARHYPVLAA